MDFSKNSFYPLGMRCNNPLNVSGTGWQGQTGTANNPEKEAIFIDTQHGLRAACILLYNYYKIHGLTTISGIINRWAPSNDPNAKNDPYSYAGYVSRQTGIGVNDNFALNAANIKAIMKAMANMEVGPKYAAMIPDQEYDQAITSANKRELLVQAGKIGGLLLLVFFSFYYIKNTK